ncbi:MAG: hypothetical protein H6R11_682 [Proteobacteria bacterium]|nr:hypothetical protein [Pseudomonadota bacterium]
MIEPGTKNGEILRGPPACTAVLVSSISGRPPMPEPMHTPMRSALAGCMPMPASLRASIAAARPKWMKVS